jgi:hypothetical protein
MTEISASSETGGDADESILFLDNTLISSLDLSRGVLQNLSNQNLEDLLEIDPNDFNKGLLTNTNGGMNT